MKNFVFTLVTLIQFTHLATLTLNNVTSNDPPIRLFKRQETDEFDDIEYLMDQNDDIDSFDDFKKFGRYFKLIFKNIIFKETTKNYICMKR